MTDHRLDLLQEPRQELGLPPAPPEQGSPRQNLIKGGVVAGGLLLLLLLTSLLLRWRNAVQRQRVAELEPVEVRVRGTEARLRALRRETDGLRSSSQGLARALVSVRSGSVLLEQMRLVAPRGVQLTDVSEASDALAFQGRSSDPDSFKRINAFELALAELPGFQPSEVAVQRVERKPLSGQPAITEALFNLRAGFDSTHVPSEAELKTYGADGMARRRAILADIGLLP
jgi:Tfp pilus assembly protein PilN